MRTVTVRAFPYGYSKSCFLPSATANLHVHSAPGHNAVVLDIVQPYKKTKKSKKLVGHGMRIEISEPETLQLIEALCSASRNRAAGVCE